MNKLLLKDLLGFSDDELKRVKIKFNIKSGDTEPLDEWLKDPEIVNNEWLLWREDRNYFSTGQIAICLVNMGWDNWLLTTIKEVGQEKGIKQGVNFEAEEVEKYKSLFGRVIITYHKNHAAQGAYLKTVAEKVVVGQILPTVYDGSEFPGYDKVRLSYAQLEQVISKNKRDWINALENQKAVYLITDKHNGKLYVGSATAESGMLLQRWSNYVSNGHGGNKELVELVNREGIEYIKNNFQYSILENYNAKIDDEFVLRRESWWKETLQSRKFGYNSN